MYFLIKIQDSNEKVVVPLKWIKNLDMTTLFNYGVKYVKKKIFTVFIYADQTVEPDFSLNTFAHLKIEWPACYKAKILKCCGKYLGCTHFLHWSMHFLKSISFLESSDMKSPKFDEDMDDSLVDEIQELLQSSDSEFEWSEDDVPRPKIWMLRNVVLVSVQFLFFFISVSRAFNFWLKR